MKHMLTDTFCIIASFNEFLNKLGPEKGVALVVSLAGILFVILLIKIFHRKTTKED